LICKNFKSQTAEDGLTPTLPDNGKFTGVDVGFINIIATSDEHYRDHPKCIRQTEYKIKKAQKTLSSKKKGLANYQRQKVKLARLHVKAAKQRADFLHKLSLWLVLNYAYIAFEKLHIPAMVKNPHLAKSIPDAGWGTLIRLVAYKSVMLRGSGGIERVDSSYTSQDCSECGCRVPKTLAERMHRCPQCGLEMDRDANAARNIEQKAFADVRTKKVGPVRPELQE